MATISAEIIRLFPNIAAMPMTETSDDTPSINKATTKTKFTKNMNFLQNRYLKIYLNLTERGKIKRTGYLERHHIIPSHAGGTNAGENLTYLTGREHVIAHLLLTRILPSEFIGGAYAAARMMTMVKSTGQDRPHKISSKTAELLKRNHAEHCRLKLTGKKLSPLTRAKMKTSQLERFANFPVSELTKQKMSVAQKQSMESGTNALSKINAAPRSDKHRNSLSAAKIGKPAAWTLADHSHVSEKISQALTGRIFSDETKLKMSKAQLGKTTWNKGKKLTDAQKKNMNRQITEEHKMALRKPKKKILCPVCNQLISSGAFKRYHEPRCS